MKIKKGQIHLHTKASDGIITSYDILQSGLDFVAITDHDTLKGYDQAVNKDYLGFNLNVIPGIELTTEHHGKGIHILIYYPIHSEGFLEMLEKSRETRGNSAHKTAEDIEKIGYYCPQEDVSKLRGTITKTDLGNIVVKYEQNKARLEKEEIQTGKEFAKKYLERGQPAHFKVPRPEFKIYHKLVHGIKVLAHPGHDLEPGKDDHIIEDLAKNYKLVGIEANSRKHENGQTEYYNNLAKELGLVVTTSADAHKPEQIIDNTVDYSVIEELIEKFKQVYRVK